MAENLPATPESCKTVTEENLKQVYEKMLQKYRLDRAKLQVRFETQNSLDNLIKELLCDPKTNEKVDEIIYQKYIEASIKKDWVWILTIENISTNIDSKILETLKNNFNTIIDKILEKYDFIPKWQKEVFKLALFNKLLSKNWDKINDLADLFDKIKDFSATDIFSAKTWDIISKVENLTSLKKVFDETLDLYTKKFDEISKDEKFTKLSPQDKQKAISNNEWFNNPILIESWAESLDISKINPTTKLDFKDDNIKKISEYMLNSRKTLEQYKNALLKTDVSIADISTRASEWDNSMSGLSVLLWFLFKFDFIREILAAFWITPDSFKEKVDKNSEEIKIFNSLKTMFSTSEKDSPFKDKKIDWDENDYINELKELNKITKQNKITDYKELFLNGFSDKWFNINWVILKFEIDFDELKKETISKESLKKAINDWISKYKEDINKKVQQEQIKEAWILKSLWERVKTKLNNTNNLKLSDWVDLWNGEFLKLDTQKQTLTIWKYSYSIEMTHNMANWLTINDIVFDWSNVKLLVKTTNFWDQESSRSKQEIVDWIIWLIETWKFTKTQDWWTLNISRIA